MKTPSVRPSVLVAWALANDEAVALGSQVIEPIHFLLAVLRMVDPQKRHLLEQIPLADGLRGNLLAEVHEARQLVPLHDENMPKVRQAIRNSVQVERCAAHDQQLHRSLASRSMFLHATKTAVADGRRLCELRDLVAVLLDDLPVQARAFLAAQPGHGLPPDAVRSQREQEKRGNVARIIGGLGRDLTEAARRGDLAPVIGRKREVTMLARFLHRTSKRNVLIVGGAGVGKTAIVEGLAQRVADGAAPDRLKHLRVIQVDVGEITAGAKYVGDLEERIRALLEEATASPDVVLFLDEIHLVMGAGRGGHGAMDVANLLKPALGRDRLRCVGATTTEEYERFLRDDPAFLRRFQLLRINEPSQEEALSICETWARRIEAVQGVRFSPEAVQAAVTLSAHLIQGRALPDKAIDLLENAAAYERVSSLTGRRKAPSKETPLITEGTIRDVLEEQYGISTNASDVLDVARAVASLRSVLVGQDDAINSLAVSLGALGARQNSCRPLGVLLFVGPSGVGKTLAAECLAQALFPNAANGLGRFNMSELKERHEMSRLIGAPPGFLGHDSQGALFRYAETSPQGLILLDEIDKAHPEIHDYFLQVFDKGEARDQKGRPVSFRRHLFVLTCNDGGPDHRERIGFAPADVPKMGVGSQSGAWSHLGLREEFLARIDCVVRFSPLTEASLRMLVERLLQGLVEQVVRKHGVAIRIGADDHARLLERCVAAGPSARGVIRCFEQVADAPVHRLLEGLGQGDRELVLRWQEDSLTPS